MANETASQQTAQKGEIILYQPDETVRLEVRLEDDTVWLTQQQMAELFQTTKNNVTLHIDNVYREKELSPAPSSKESLLVRMESNRQVARRVKLYNLDVIISVGYRVKSQRGTGCLAGGLGKEVVLLHPDARPHHRNYRGGLPYDGITRPGRVMGQKSAMNFTR